MLKKMPERAAAGLMSLALLLSLTPAALASDPPAAARDGALQELARQLQDRTADPFAFRPGAVLAEEADYPVRFDLRNVDTDGDGEGDTSFVTPVKLQDPFATCWGFAAIAAAETSILGNDELAVPGLDAQTMDLSEKHLTWFIHSTVDDPENPQYGEGLVFAPGPEGDSPMDAGGFNVYSTGFFASGIGPVFDVDSYPADDGAEIETNFRYHGKEKLVDWVIREEDGNVRLITAPEDEPPEGEHVIAYQYSAKDDWSIDPRFKWFQSFKLKESYMLPTPAGKEEEARAAAIDAVKEQLMERRAVEVAFCADTSMPGEERTTKYISPNWAHYTYDNAMANHIVAIVGWDDAYPKENFRHTLEGLPDEEAWELTTPAHDGAWLVKNSWGSEEEAFPNNGQWGLKTGQDDAARNYEATEDGVHTGYFWLSYDDQSAEGFEAFAFDRITEKAYSICQYDLMPVSKVRSAYLSDAVQMANVFWTDADARLDQVTCETTAPGTHVKYEIYLLDAGSDDPTDGILLTEHENTYPWGGFHKETLPEPPLLHAGQYFSVVVTQQAPDGKYALSIHEMWNRYDVQSLIDAGQPINYGVGVVNPGESSFYVGGDWHDLSERWIKELMEGDLSDHWALDNFPIKAYLDPGEAPAAQDAGSFVSGAYETILNREADEAGLAHWTAALEGGTGAAEVLLSFFTSDEFLARGLGTRETAVLCCRAMLAREPGEEEIAQWSALLEESGSVAMLVAALAGEEAFRALCEDCGIRAGEIKPDPSEENGSVTDFVERCYAFALSREADGAGLDEWCAHLLNKDLTPERVAFGFVFSDEAKGRGLDDEAFIAMLYRMMLDREPDADGLANWVNALQQNTAAEIAYDQAFETGRSEADAIDQTRQNIYATFAQSAEFALMCNNFGF